MSVYARPAIWGTSPHGGADDQGDGRFLRPAGCRPVSRRSLELGSYAVRSAERPADGVAVAGRG
jgi:hypothetical protein